MTETYLTKLTNDKECNKLIRTFFKDRSNLMNDIYYNDVVITTLLDNRVKEYIQAQHKAKQQQRQRMISFFGF